jgi:subtilisin family serine protease
MRASNRPVHAVVNSTTRRTTLLLVLAGAVLLACAGAVLAQSPTTKSASPKQAGEGTNDERVIPDQYIVVLKEDGTEEETSARRGGQDPTQVANEQAQEHGLEVRDVYENTIKGYAAEIPEDELQEVEDDPRVAFVEQDQVTEANKKKKKKKKKKRSSPAPTYPAPTYPAPTYPAPTYPAPTYVAPTQALPWGINQIDADVSSTKAGDGTGTVSNVNAYILDTGLVAHNDLNVINPAAFNAFGNGQNYDCNGHGTHVAGTVAAKDDTSDVVGVVPGAPLTGVKVLGCDGRGTISGVIAGVEWVTANARKPAIANMSLGGGASDALDEAVKKSVESGIFYSVSAGNDGADACTKSPARAGAGTNNGIITVAATDSSGAEASFSNYGGCVDIWAPGVSVLSTSVGGGTTTKLGTSMASPHAGGAGALYLSRNTSASASAVEAQLKTDFVAASTKSKDGTAIEHLFAGKY